MMFSDGAYKVPSALSFNVWQKKLPRITKIVDETIVLKRPRRGAKLKEEVWHTDDGQVVKYSLVYINPRICVPDNGRVLGYDNSHDYHRRHFMRAVEPVKFDIYELVFKRFHAEVCELWRNEDEKHT